jgi:hypothetical protein
LRLTWPEEMRDCEAAIQLTAGLRPPTQPMGMMPLCTVHEAGAVVNPCFFVQWAAISDYVRPSTCRHGDPASSGPRLSVWHLGQSLWRCTQPLDALHRVDGLSGGAPRESTAASTYPGCGPSDTGLALLPPPNNCQLSLPLGKGQARPMGAGRLCCR